MGKKTRTIVEPTEVKMNKEVKEKLSYEELENVARQQSMRMRDMHDELNQAKDFIMNRRAEFLFKVLDNKEAFSDEIIRLAVDEISESLYPKVEQEKEDTTINKEQ